MHSNRPAWVVCLLSFFWSLFAFQILSLQPLYAETKLCSDLPEGFQFRTLVDETGSHQYAVFVPRQYDPNQKWPVVLFLHGAGEKGTDPRWLLSGQLSVALEKWPETPFIAVFPQCEDLTSRALTGWLADGSDGLRAMKILDQVEQDYSIDPKRRILLGWSMGGYGAWSLAARYPEKWSAVMALAGGAIHDQLPLQGLAERKTPVWAISAQDDPLIPFERSQRLVQQLNAAGGNATFTLLESRFHDFTPQLFAAPQVFQWLLDPSSVKPEQIDFQHVDPLPGQTRYYDRCIVELKTIPNSLAMRLGNAPFEQMAGDLPELLTSTPLSGTLANVDQTFGQPGNQMRVQLTDLSYHCEVGRIWAHGISGGRLGLEIDFQPLELIIGQTTLDSARSRARTGPIHIRVGIHKPAVLRLEVQPVILHGELKLRLLRKDFSFDNGNWYIEPPQQVEAHSDQFTSDQLVTGIVGSLYGSRQDLIDRILGVIPELLQQTEQELQQRSAPGLARLLSPLPVLVPDLKVSPSAVRTDAQGVSVICDMKVASRSAQDFSLPLKPLQIQNLPTNDRLSLELALDAVTAVSQLTVDQNMAVVNVLDISEDGFARLANPQFMNEVLPDMHAAEEEQLETLLRLLHPMQVQGTSGETASASTQLELQSSGVALDIFRRSHSRTTSQPVGRILFSLHQTITIEPPSDQDSPEAAFEMRWNPECEVLFLRAESLNGSPVPQVNGERFQKVFHDAWSAWGQAHGQQQIPMTVSRMGASRLRLERLQADKEILKLFLGVSHNPPAEHESQ